MINDKRIKPTEVKFIYSRAEVKEMFNISYPTLNKLNKTGELPAKKLGRKVYYLLDDIMNSINSKAFDS